MGLWLHLAFKIWFMTIKWVFWLFCLDFQIHRHLALTFDLSPSLNPAKGPGCRGVWIFTWFFTKSSEGEPEASQAQTHQQSQCCPKWRPNILGEAKGVKHQSQKMKRDALFYMNSQFQQVFFSFFFFLLLCPCHRFNLLKTTIQRGTTHAQLFFNVFPVKKKKKKESAL